MKADSKITVFTPTYNRAYIIENLYRSLQRQTFRDFEWLVVDDGSSDNTEELFRTWQNEENNFPIRYYKQENGGKHTAINRGLNLANGTWFFTVDSDDYLTDDALEKVAHWVDDLPNGEKFCGISANLGTSPTQTPNTIFDTPYIEDTAFARYGAADGERAMVIATEIHRQYLYPVFAGERFMTEAVTWNRMANDGYKMRFYNDIIWVYEYKEDGLTKAGSKLFLNNPKGYGLWLREKSAFLNEGLKARLQMYYTFTCDLHARLASRQIAQCIGAPRWLIFGFYILRNIINLFRK